MTERNEEAILFDWLRREEALAVEQRAHYRVARHSEHGLRWWPPGAVIPPENTDVRRATAEEVALMQHIRLCRDPPVSWGQKLAAVMERNGP